MADDFHRNELHWRLRHVLAIPRDDRQELRLHRSTFRAEEVSDYYKRHYASTERQVGTWWRVGRRANQRSAIQLGILKGGLGYAGSLGQLLVRQRIGSNLFGRP